MNDLEQEVDIMDHAAISKALAKAMNWELHVPEKGAMKDMILYGPAGKGPWWKFNPAEKWSDLGWVIEWFAKNHEEAWRRTRWGNIFWHGPAIDISDRMCRAILKALIPILPNDRSAVCRHPPLTIDVCKSCAQERYELYGRGQT